MDQGQISITMANGPRSGSLLIKSASDDSGQERDSCVKSTGPYSHDRDGIDDNLGQQYQPEREKKEKEASARQANKMIRAKANTYNFAVTFFVALGSFTYGYNSSVMASVLGLPSFFSYFNIDVDTNSGSSITGAINGVYVAGGAIGCWTLYWLADRLGRKRCIQIISLLCILSAALQAGSVHIAMLLVARCLNGFGVGMINCIIPTYQSELAPASQRGRLVGAHGVLIVTGYSLGGFTGYGVYFESNPAIQWRLCLALQIVAPLMLLVGSPWIPESPRWLIARGRDAEGISILQKLHATADDPEASTARDEYLQVKEQVQLEAGEVTHNIFTMMKRAHLRKRLLLGFFLQWLAQSSGVLVVFNYQILLYRNMGLTGSVPLLLLALYNALAAFMNFVNSLLVDHLGRIRIMTIGIIGCATMMILHTAMFATYAGGTNKVGNGFAIAFLFLFVFFYGGSLDATSYIYCSEIFPTAVRAQGVGFSVSGLFLSNLVYTQAAPTAFNNIGWRYYLVFIVVPLAGLPFLVKFYPETKGLSLEEAEECADSSLASVGRKQIAGLFGDPVAFETSATGVAAAALNDKQTEKSASTGENTPEVFEHPVQDKERRV
ncbi:sugar transporter [Cladophialophora carrionii]|uniref:Sugar transporter n=1 Tax=Cladophialophora carrionii TaxID=86049 RepID=A0A1C1CTE8_9EURO|nr:sugar transporter [Cladophialophora carrionii]